MPLHILRLKEEEWSIELLLYFRLGKRSISDQNYIISLVRKLQKASLDKNSPEKTNQDLVERNKTNSSEDPRIRSKTKERRTSTKVRQRL